MSEDFTRALANAQKLPDVPDDLQDSIPDLLSGPAPRAFASRVGSNVEGKIPNAVEYNFTYHCNRFVVGRVSTGYNQMGKEEYDDQDDSPHLKEVMDLHLQGKVIISKKTETFLKDGTVVIWLEWMAPKLPPSKEERDYLIETELRSPESSNDGFDDPGESPY